MKNMFEKFFGEMATLAGTYHMQLTIRRGGSLFPDIWHIEFKTMDTPYLGYCREISNECLTDGLATDYIIDEIRHELEKMNELLLGANKVCFE